MMASIDHSGSEDCFAGASLTLRIPDFKSAKKCGSAIQIEVNNLL
jgi:hypothetical protein